MSEKMPHREEFENLLDKQEKEKQESMDHAHGEALEDDKQAEELETESKEKQEKAKELTESELTDEEKEYIKGKFIF